MNPASGQYFVLVLPLRPGLWQQSILEKRFESGRQVYNALLGKAEKRFRQMTQTRAWRFLQEQLQEETDPAVRKKLLQEKDVLVRQYSLGKYEICREATAYRRHFAAHLDSPTVQNLAAEVWQAIEAMLKGRALQVREKGPGELKSLAGKTNNSSIRFRDSHISWKGLVIPAGLKGNSYEQEALKKELRFCRIKRETIRGKKRYFAELVFQGTPPLKKGGAAVDRAGTGRDETGTVREEGAEVSAQRTVGVKTGFWKLAAVSGREAILIDLPAKDLGLERRKRELSRYLERSRRQMNPDKYLEDGRVRAGSFGWKYSNRYRRARLQYQELCRKQRALQREQQFFLAGHVASMGERFYIEEISFLKLGKQKPGSLGLQGSCPAAFLRILEQKIRQQEKEAVWIQPSVLKTSGFSHHTGTYQKTPRKKNWRVVDGQKVDKKLYSAFLLSHTAADLKSFDLEGCREEFPAFLELQEKCLEQYGTEPLAAASRQRTA